jgi:hypothetical protein
VRLANAVIGLHYSSRVKSQDMSQQCVVQVNNVLYKSTMCFTRQQCVVQVNNVLYKATMCCTSQQCVVQVNNVLYKSTMCCTSQQCVVQGNNVLYKSTMCCTRQHTKLQINDWNSHKKLSRMTQHWLWEQRNIQKDNILQTARKMNLLHFAMGY